MKKISILICCLLLVSCQEKINLTKKEATTHKKVEQSSTEPKQEKVEQKKVEATDEEVTEEKEQTKQEVTTQAKEEKSETEYSDMVINVPTTKEFRIIVNKKNPLGPDYNNGENEVAKKAMLKLKADMQEKGFSVSDYYSGFRSFERQQELYNNYVATDGKENADRYSARPGFSEHQTGLAFDLIDGSGALLGTNINDGASEWLANNAYRYGFVVRYTEEKESVTGYIAESWHIRFVGNDAKNIYLSGLTLEEYYDVVGGDYK